MRLGHSVAVIFFTLALTLSHAAEERVWTGSNGKTFIGVFQRLTIDGKGAEFLTSDGKSLKVALDRFAPADREVLLRLSKQGDESSGTEVEPIINLPYSVFELDPKFPISFKSAVNADRDWHTRDGKSARASIVSQSGSKVTLKKVPGGQQVTLDRAQLDEKDAVALDFWEASKGMPFKFPRVQLDYRIDTPNGVYQVTICAEGSLGRIDTMKDGVHNFLIFDRMDGSFVMDKRWTFNGKKFHSDYKGRFVEYQMEMRNFLSRNSQDEMDEFASNILPASIECKDALMPCRTMQLPLGQYGNYYREPRVDYVLSEKETVLTALRMVLTGPTPRPGAFAVVTPIHHFPMNPDTDNLFSILGACKILPVHMSWVALRSQYNTGEALVRNHGRFSLALTGALLPETFPTEHFAIPDHVRSIERGTADNKLIDSPE